MPATADDGATTAPEASIDPATAGAGAAGAEEHIAELVESDVLVEDVSIDGMCGVY